MSFSLTTLILPVQSLNHFFNFQDNYVYSVLHYLVSTPYVVGLGFVIGPVLIVLNEVRFKDELNYCNLVVDNQIRVAKKATL